MRNRTVAAATRPCESKLDVAIKQLEAVDAVLEAWLEADKRPDLTVMFHLHNQVIAAIKFCKKEAG